MAQGQPDLLPGRPRPGGAEPTAHPPDPAGSAGPVRRGRTEKIHDRRRTGRATRCRRDLRGGDALTGYRAALRVRRGDASTGTLTDFPVEVSEGEVILDVLHRLQL